MSDFRAIVLGFHAENAGVPLEVAEARWNGLNQTFQICIATGNPVVASGPVDELLHDVLQYTEDFEKYCLAIYGKRFHHRPEPKMGQPSGYMDTRKLAEQKFGPLSESVWPIGERPRWSFVYTLD